MTRSKHFSLYLSLILLVVTAYACGPAEMIPFERSDEEQAADLLINNRLLYHFDRAFTTIENDRFVVIELVKNGSTVGHKKIVSLIYDREKGKWNSFRSFEKHNSYTASMQVIKKKKVCPNSSWLEVMTALMDREMLTLGLVSNGKYVRQVPQEESFILKIRIADRFREIKLVDLKKEERQEFLDIVSILDQTFEVQKEN